MSRGFALCVAILLTTGCNPDKQTKVDQDKIVFATDDASRLFFKNVRKIYYELEVMEAAKLDVYRHKQRELSTDVPVINLAIVDNWRYDEAYLLLEPNELIGTQGELAVQWELGAERGKIVFRPGNKAAQVAFADKVYHRLQLGCSFKIQINDTWIPFLDSDKSREAFRITMFDYYRLVKRI
ncbi:hypothetical protein [Roseivirga sp. E12]|uniref:hypothetical protein n=1 Tax=Roseivirga sp. E12 TaxID=2819237 RepID=UPI001ABBF162|nr:hypothetical protein [Roseivirga sp. E12]MBO3698788.1 hypothetical protein [Roseivirga sp. E12]